MVFHALLTVAGGHLTIMRGGRSPNHREMFHRGETYRLLNKMLSDPRQATSDVGRSRNPKCFRLRCEWTGRLKMQESKKLDVSSNDLSAGLIRSA